MQSAHLTLPAGLEQIAPIANTLAAPTREVGWSRGAKMLQYRGSKLAI